MAKTFAASSRLIAVLCFYGTAACAVELPRAGSECDRTPEALRWFFAGTPDIGRTPPLLSAHRGGTTLAPENTIWAYRHAFAYDMDFVEIDVRETFDGVFVSLHDDTVDRTTDGTGLVSLLTWSQIEPLNAADYAPWKGSEYDPARVPRLEDILALARDSDKGIEFDVKFVRDYARFFDLVASYGLLSRSYFSISGDDATAAQTYNPEIRVIFNLDGTETPDLLYRETRRTAVYGSQLDRFTPEDIVAIHDGCSFALPHSYDLGVVAEAEELKRARAEGADGAQIDQPDVVAHVAERHVPAQLSYRAETREVCLRNTNNGLGIPRRLLSVFQGVQLPKVGVTNRDGCVTLPEAAGEYWIVHFGTPAVQQAAIQVDTAAGG